MPKYVVRVFNKTVIISGIRNEKYGNVKFIELHHPLHRQTKRITKMTRFKNKCPTHNRSNQVSRSLISTPENSPKVFHCLPSDVKRQKYIQQWQLMKYGAPTYPLPQFSQQLVTHDRSQGNQDIEIITHHLRSNFG